MVPDFNGHSIPVEVVPFAWEVTSQRIAILGGQPTLRIRDGQTFVTDNMNFILDTIFTEVVNPIGLHQSLKSIVGVVETGLFVGMSDWVIIATNNGTKLYSRDSNV